MKPTEPRRPQFSTEGAQAIVLKLWNLRGTARELPSERDQNFHIADEKGTEYVLKIANAREKRDILELQIQAIRHLAQHVADCTWPEVLKTSAGEDVATIEHWNGTKHFVRLMRYLSGRFLSQIRPHSPGLLRSLGVFLGSMDKAFASFQHPAADRELKWNMKFAPSTIHGSFKHIADPEGRALVQHFLKRYVELTLPLLPRLRTSVIHNDANDNNILVGRASSDPGAFDLKVSGIIDFGDTVAGFPVLELAVGAAYAAL